MNQADKIQKILDILLKYTVMDFSEKIDYDMLGDEIDAIALGLNTLAEELESHVQQLNERTEQNQIIFDNAPDAMMVINEAGKISRWNPEAVLIFGWEPEEIIGSMFSDKLIYEHSKALFAEEMSVYDAQNKTAALNKKIELILMRKGGEVFEAELSISPTISNRQLLFIGIVSDISSRKQHEKMMLQSRLDAEESSMLKETFLANMSHEIRTPMNAIVGFTDLLMKKNLGPEEREYVDTIRKSGETLLTIINDILDISKIEAGLVEFQEDVLSVKEICHSLNAMLSQKATEKGLDLIFNIDSHVPDVFIGDTVRLTQIMINLINNAIKFTQQGSVTIAISELRTEGEKSVLEFVFTDTGVGIPEDRLEHIFERFRQVQTHTTRQFGGTGLGLSICKHLIELQGGELSVESKLNVGSSFKMVLPLKKAGKELVVPDNKKIAPFNLSELGKLRMLLVEDNPMNIKLIQHLFSQHGLSAEIAVNGRIAVDRLKTDSFDIILMDMEMPEMSGYDATICIRGELKNNTPIIAMTAHAMAGERERCLLLGMNDYISKPINADLLFSKIYQVTLGSN